MRKDKGLKVLCYILISLLSLLSFPTLTLSEIAKEIKIGILAYRGKEEATKRWSPTADYLTLSIPSSKFTVVPLDFNEIGPATRDKKIDFIITNTSIYVELESAYGISRIATLKNRWKDRGYTVFGGVIFTRSDRNDIKEIKDLKGKAFMAVDETSLGGWRMAWREMKDKGINPYRDLKSLRFGTTHDRVVMAVLKGEVDAGTVRTDIIERMAERGIINIKDLKVINKQSVEGFPFLLSTRLYPEWPFAKLRHVPEELSERVAIALLSMPHNGIAAITSESAGWTTPLDYYPVHELMKELRVGPYKDFGKVTFSTFVKQYWYLILLTIGIIVSLTVLVIIVTRLNRKVMESRLRIQHAMEGLEILVKERTSELESKNRELTLEIEKRKRTEEEITKAKAEWEQIFDSVPDLIAIIGQDNKILRANKPLLEKIKGLGLDIDKNCYELLCSMTERERETKCPRFRMFKEGIGHSQELYIDRLGSYYLITASPLKDHKGNVVACIHVARDITERKRAELLLRESEEKFRSLVEQSLVGVYIIQDGHFIYANPEMARIFGYETEEIINKKSPYDLTDEEYHPAVRENIRRRLEGNVKAVRYTFKGRRKDGSLIDVEALGTLTEIAGKPAIIGTINDITEEIQREKEKESQRRFLQSILDSMPDYIMVIRPDYRVALANLALCEVIKSDALCYSISHGRDIPCEGIEHPCPLKRVIEEKRVFRTTHSHIKHDGSEMILEIIASPIFDEKGEIVYVLEVSRDITERVRLEEEHRRLMERLYLEEKDHALIALTGGIAHDFNNMLMAVLGSAELLRMKAKKEDLSYIDNIIKSSEKMANLVKQILAYSGQGIYQLSNININASIEKALKMTHKGKYLNIKVDLEMDEGLWPIFADRSQMEQMLVNLILNAFEAMEERGGTLSIKTSNIRIIEPVECRPLNWYLPAGDYVKITVSDSGPGIPLDLHKKIFDPFFTTKFMGRGLGLPAVSGIVKSHNGCLHLESEEGKGTTITVYLPRAVELVEKEVRPSIKENKGILVVDDDEAILDLIKESLSGAGFDIYTATNGFKALDKFKELKEQIKLAIIDIEMPEMDGTRLVSELRGLSKDLNIIISSGYDEDTALKGIEPRPDAFIQKPYRLSLLLSKVKEFIR